ncbi:hypothetical protein [Terrisporobacter sp.]
MSFYKGELETLNLKKIQDGIVKNYFISVCNNGKSSRINICENEDIISLLKKYNELYCFFGKRKGEYLSCINGKNYFVDDERSTNSKGIYMADAYFNKYDDINLGFLFQYKEGIVDIKPAIEGESIDGRMYEVVENCGDIYVEMAKFINKFII